MRLRLGGTKKKPGREPVQRPVHAATAGRELYETLGEQLAGLPLHQQLELGGALVERQRWDDLAPWVRETFRAAAERLRR